MKNIHGQVQLSLIVPPRIGPRIGAVVVVIAQIARPIPAFSFGKMRSSNICDSGISGPPASPWSTRNSTSAPDRKSVASGRDVYVSVDLGGQRIIKKITITYN